MKVEITGKVGRLKVSPEYDEASQAIVVTIAVKVKMAPEDIARILFLQTKKMPLFFNIGCTQSAFDLLFTERIEQSSLLDGGVKKPLDEILEAAQKAETDAESEKTGIDNGTLPPGAVVTPAAEPAPPIKLVECPECHGSGKSNDPGFCCDICRGVGSVSSRAVIPEEIVFSVGHHAEEPGHNGNGKTPKRRGRKSKKEAPVVLSPGLT